MPEQDSHTLPYRRHR